jgi:hypothetical protein
MCTQSTNYKLQGMIHELQCSLLSACKLLLTRTTHVWIFEQAIVICDSQAIVALGPMASNLQRLISFGYKFTSSLLGLQPW